MYHVAMISTQAIAQSVHLTRMEPIMVDIGVVVTASGQTMSARNTSLVTSTNRRVRIIFLEDI